MKMTFVRFFFCYLLATFSFLHSFSQKKNVDKFNFSKFYKKKLSIPASGKLGFTGSTSGDIQVLDWREDTTSIGFQGNDYFTIPHIKAAFKDQLLSLIDFKQDSTLAASKLLVCLHKLWITQHLPQSNEGWKSGIIWKVDCFKKVGDTFTYLCRLDTTITGSKNIRFCADELIPLCLQLSAEKITSALHQPGQRDEYPNLNQFKMRFNNIPVLHDVQKKKGLYMTYEQFLNNEPVSADFEIERDKLTDALFVLNSKDSYELIRNVWGYCDGQNMYIKSGEKYFALCRVDNTFYFYGAENIRKSVYSDPGTASLLNVATNTNRKITKYYLSYYPFQLDIISGNFY